MPNITVKINSKKFRVKDCKGLSSAKGLMFDKLGDKDGALIYANDIWMPFVKKNLNLIFLDDKMKVIEQKTAVPVSFSPATWKTYKSKAARYCLELKDTKLRVKKGTRVEIL